MGYYTDKATLETRKRTQAEDEKKKLMYELEAKNTKQERFIYTVSHDLRSPLLAIRGFESMLRDDLKENGREKVVKDFYFIDNAAAKMEQLMDDSLQLFHIGRMANLPEDVPFAEIINEALKQTRQQIGSSGVKVTVADDFPVVKLK